MGFANPRLLKTLLSWLRRSVGIPLTLLVLYLEVYPSSVVLHRLSHRLRRSSLACILKKKGHARLSKTDLDNNSNDFFFVAGADVMDRALSPSHSPSPSPSQHKPTSRALSRKRSLTINQRAGSGASPISYSFPQQPPSSSATTPASTSTSITTTTTTTTPAAATPATTATGATNASPPASAPLPLLPPYRRHLSSPSPFPSTPTRAVMQSHTRSKSHADVLKQGKRLSLQFPLQPAAGSNSPLFSPRSRPQSWVAAPSPSQSDTSGLNTPSSPETNILAILAAQERYVMELKEELTKAEGDLKTLKKHYATHQAVKVAVEARRITQLQPLNTTLANFPEVEPDDDDGSTLWMQREMERRKALLSNTKSSQRKVFSGSRHLRTLSLLSPDKSYTPSFPQPLDLRGEDSSTTNNGKDNDDASPMAPPLIRHATSPDIANHIADTHNNNERYDLGGLPNIQREALLRTGKQMATDFRDGLLTFIEDIRQATVGEEALEGNLAPAAARGPAAKGGRKPSDGRPTLNRTTSSKKPAAQKTGAIGDEFWKEHGLSEPTAVPTNKKTHPLKNLQTPQKQAQSKPDDFEDWDSWDTPNDQSLAKTAENDNNNSSSDESDAPSSPFSGPSSSRTSTRYHSQRHDSKASSLTTSSSMGNVDDITPRDQKRSSIPWPDLVKLSPNHLKRTASHLMKEWEKQLTPPPEARDSSHSTGDYVGRSASPAALP